VGGDPRLGRNTKKREGKGGSKGEEKEGEVGERKMTKRGKVTMFHTGTPFFPLPALCNYINSGAKHIQKLSMIFIKLNVWRLKCIKCCHYATIMQFLHAICMQKVIRVEF